MKRMIFILALSSFGRPLLAQTFDEWFNQKKTQIKYLLQQIAANEVYIGYLQKGYKIAEGGLQTINAIKHGDFNLHQDYFNSLKSVNPKIQNLAKVAAIISFQLEIVKQTKSALQYIKVSNQFTSTEITYLQNVFNHLLDECTKYINDLLVIITSGETEMSDDERMKRIDAVYYEMQEKFSFCKSFSSEATQLAMQRSLEQINIDVSKKLYGLK